MRDPEEPILASRDDIEAFDPYRSPKSQTPTDATASTTTSDFAPFSIPREATAASIFLFLLTALSCFALGGAVFAAAILAITGAHSLGHLLVARRHGADCVGPFFVPYPNPLFGTWGAFLRFRWPITSRRALVWIFLAGPMAGLLVSALAIAVGLPMSTIEPAQSGLIEIEFGTSILTRVLESLLVPPGQDNLVLSPLAFAGWIGVHLNTLHLLPVGRFDGGRVVTAVFGYSVFRIVSPIVLSGMFALTFLNGGKPYVALLALATHWRLREQYEGLEEASLTVGQKLGALSALGLLLVLSYPLFPVNVSID